MRLSPGLLLSALLIAPAHAQSGWVERSNEHAQVLIEAQARIAPEGASRQGVEAVDREIVDLKPGFQDRHHQLLESALGDLRRRLELEQDNRVRQDLRILIDSADLELRRAQASKRLELPYLDLARTVYFGLTSLLQDQVAPARRPAALVRLLRYTGLETGYEPVAKLAEQRVREKLPQPNLLYPFQGEIEKHLTESGLMLAGIEPLFQKHGLAGHEEPLARLKEQFEAYQVFIRKEVLPKARTDFRMPAELYALALEGYGNDMQPADLAQRARGAFLEIQGQMQEIAGAIARERKLPSSDYRGLIQELKKKQLTGEEILLHYHKRLAQIEEIVRREDLVTLPDRPAVIRLATPAESAASPAPHMQPPRLIGNTGETGAFVLPLNVPGAAGQMLSYDDFTFDAASWTLTAHEVRPGHELQFASMVEQGVSLARAIFAFNSTNVEGWALYTEAVLKPFMPLEGQLISLQHRLMRAGRAFLDPELQLGRIRPADARRILLEDVVLSEAMVNQELERYMFRMPGQAASYFYGYTRLMEIRSDVQKMMGPKFNQRAFHDFVLKQGLLPPGLLRKAVLEEFVTAH